MSMLIELCIIQRSSILGLLCNKIGGKKEINFQPMHDNEFLRIIRRSFRNSTEHGSYSPLRLKLD